jgi:putative membrane protein
MIYYDRLNWRKTVFSLKGTALQKALLRILLAVLFATVIQAAYREGVYHVAWMKTFVGLDPTSHAVLGSLLGFLIVFRMNASNARYWEGRALWGQIINCSRNLARAGIEYTNGGEELANLIIGYTICLRRSLQGDNDTLEADRFLPDDVLHDAKLFSNKPVAVAAAITEWIAQYRRNGQLDPQLVRHCENELSRLVDAQGGCERILKTPLPFVYVVMIKQLILVYLATLPIALCDRIGWWTPLLVAIVSLGLFGMEEASVEIENPFSKDDNCLDMESYTVTIARDLGQMVARKSRLAGSQRA